MKRSEDDARPRLELIPGGAAVPGAAESSDDAALEEALRALEPKELASADHEALLALALGSVFVEPEVGEPELREATALSHALDGAGTHELARFAAALRFAGGSRVARELAPADRDALLVLALRNDMDGDALHGTSLAREVAAARALTEALDRGSEHPLVGVAAAMRAAHGGETLDELTHARLIRRALRTEAGERGAARLRTVLGVLGALAAGVALAVSGFTENREPSAATAARLRDGSSDASARLIAPHTTAALFDATQPFATTGGESERMARIVTARAADLRANRFAAWGVR